MIEEGLVASLKNNKRAFTIYNLFKTQLCLKEFTEEQKTAFLLVPCFLHTATPRYFGEIDGVRAPAGIYNFIWNDRTSKLMSEYFPKEHFNLTTVQHPSPIEFLSLMGSVGSIAYTDKSDFDFWVCIRHDIEERDKELLQKKLILIEKWCEEVLNVEVHFFMTSSEDLKNNNFGSVSTESCGSALGKLLKEEYYRGSLLIAGKTPLWWGLPVGVDDQDYQRISEELLENRDDYNDTYIDIGNIHAIPEGEFLGGGLWQLNKSVGSPFKSVLKMALLMEYSDAKSNKNLVATQVKEMIFNNPSAMSYLDPYQNMLDRILGYYENNGSAEELHLMRQCFFLKIAPKVERWMSSPQKAPRNVDSIMVDYCRDWQWKSEDIKKCEDFKHLGLAESIDLKNRCEHFMQKSLHKLESLTNSNQINLSMSDLDRTKMINRLHSVYDDSRQKSDIIFPPFKSFIHDDSYTLKPKEGKDSTKEWHLFKGEQAVKSTNERLEEKGLLHQSHNFSDLLLWLASNGVVNEKTNLKSSLTQSDHFQRNLRHLCNEKGSFFRQAQTPSFDEADFSQPAYPKQWLICVDIVPKELGENSEIKPFLTELQIKKNKHASLSEVLNKISLEDETLSLDKRQGEVIKINTFLPKRHDTFDSSELRRYRLRKLRTSDDPLNAWEPKYCLLQNAILLEKNSWGEYSAHDYHDVDWLARLLTRILTHAFKHKIDLDLSVDFFIGRGFYKNVFLEDRFKSLLYDILDFFSQAYDGSNGDVRVFYYEKGGWVYTLIQQDDKFNVQSFDCWLKAMMSVNILFTNVKITSGFDSWTEQGQFYSVANAFSKLDRIDIYLLDNPDTVFLIVIDEKGNCSTNEIPRKELRSYLPKYIYGVAKSIHKVKSIDEASILNNTEESISVNWITIDPKGGIYTQDITQSSLKIVAKDMSKISKLNASIHVNQVKLFMLQFAYRKDAAFKDKATRNLLLRILNKINKLRGEENTSKVYDIFLTGVDLDGLKEDTLTFNSKLLPSSVSGWLNLKLALEFSCLQILNKDQSIKVTS